VINAITVLVLRALRAIRALRLAGNRVYCFVVVCLFVFVTKIFCLLSIDSANHGLRGSIQADVIA